MTVNFLRHASWVGPEQLDMPLNIIGCGAIGSNLALLAAKMGFYDLILWDPDVVEAHNLPNQAFDHHHVNQPKVVALEEVLKRFNPEIKVTTHQDYFTPEHKGLVEGILFIATDTMSSRQSIAEAFRLKPLIDAVYEVRIGFDYGEINYIDHTSTKTIESWLNGLRSDEEVEEGPCSLRICATLVGIIVAEAVHMMCAQHALTTEDWQPPKKTLFCLTPELQVHTIK